MERLKRSTRDGVFAYRTVLGRRWGVDYRDPVTRTRKRKAGFESKKEALQFRDRMERQTLGLLPRESTIRFKDAVKSYVDHRLSEGKSVRSYYHLVVSCARGVRPGFWVHVFGERELASVTSAEVESVLCSAVIENGWSAATYNRALAQLSGLFNYARRHRWVHENPVNRGRVPRRQENNARTRWLRLHELDAILAASPDWLAVIVKFAVATGMRLGEVCGLTKACIQHDERGLLFVVTERTKNGERMAWPLEGWTRTYVEHRAGAAKFLADYLFPGPGGGHAYTSVHHTLPRVVKKAGLKYGRKHADGVTFHTLRHTMASLAINHGVPLATVQRMGNWKTQTMVARYAHFADETLRQGAAALSRVIDQPRRQERGGPACVETA